MKAAYRLLLCHGFNVRDGGANTLDKLVGHLTRPNIRVKQADYGHQSLFDVLKQTDNLAAMLNGLSEKGDIGVGHSHGCALLVKAAERGAPFKQLHLINPALIEDYPFPAHIERIFVYHSKGDWAVRAARWLRFIPLIGQHKNYIWGRMGATGYKGQDPRVVNINLSDKYLSHSGAFEDDNAQNLAVLIRDKIKHAK